MIQSNKVCVIANGYENQFGIWTMEQDYDVLSIRLVYQLTEACQT